MRLAELAGGTVLIGSTGEFTEWSPAVGSRDGPAAWCRGAIGAKLAEPGRRVLAATGDGAFLMNSQEIETALRERIPLTVLIWQDDAYGLIRWKMDLELGHDVATGFSNPDLMAYAESFGARGYRVNSAADLLPILTEALAADTVSVIACPVDYSENLRLTDALGELSGPF